MAENSIYVENSIPFLNQDGILDNIVEYKYIEDDNIGIKNIPTVYTCKNYLHDNNIPIISEYFSPIDSTNNGVEIKILYETTDNINDSIKDLYVSFTNINDYVDYLTAVKVDFTYNTTLSSGIYYTVLSFISGQLYDYFTQVPVGCNFKTIDDGAYSIKNNYINFTGNYGDDFLPIDSFHSDKNLKTDYANLNNDASAGFDVYVDLTFSGWISNSMFTDCICALDDIKILNLYSECVKGYIKPIKAECYSTNQYFKYLNSDLICCLTDFNNYTAEINTISGTLTGVNSSVISSDMYMQSMTLDIGLFPIQIKNFSIDEEEYIFKNDTLSVDVIDDIYGITISGTYITINDNLVDIYNNVITDGYRLFCSTSGINFSDDFMEITIFTENTVGQTLDKSYYLTSGYLVDYKNNDLNYGYSNNIPVRLSVSNEASCPTVDTFGYYFSTLPKHNKDISSSINGIKPHKYSGAGELSSTIEPFNIYYEYGKEFVVEINVKDFSGNSMLPYIFKYKIEDN